MDNGYIGYYAKDIYTDVNAPSKFSTTNDGFTVYNGGEGNCYLIAYNGTQTAITLPQNIGGYNYAINQGAFYGCTGLTSVTIPNSVTGIGDSVFEYCTKLTSVTIPNSATSIGGYAFYGCTKLTSITIPNNVTRIGRSAFYGCTGLTSVTIGNGVTNIGVDAFNDCYKLVEVYNLSDLTITKGSNSNGFVGYSAKDIYTDINEPSKLSTTNDGFIVYNGGENDRYLIGYTGTQTAVTLPQNIGGYNYAIYKCAFSNYPGLTSVTIPNGVTSIDIATFYECIKLTKVYYKGTAAEWDNISIANNNSPLKNATKYYYSETQPEGEGNYWHYGTDGVTPVVW